MDLMPECKNDIYRTVGMRSVPSWGDNIPVGSLLFSWKSVRGKDERGPSYFNEVYWKDLVWVVGVAAFLTAALLLILVR